jgi:hypothetical protein
VAAFGLFTALDGDAGRCALAAPANIICGPTLNDSVCWEVLSVKTLIRFDQFIILNARNMLLAN